MAVPKTSASHVSGALAKAAGRVLSHEERLARVSTSILRTSGLAAAKRFEAKTRASLVAAAGDGGWTPPHEDELIDVDAIVAALRGKSDPIRRSAIEDYGSTLKRLAPELDWDVTNPLVGGVLAGSAQHVRGIADTTRINLMRIVRRSYEEGLSIEDTGKAIRAGMSGAAKVRGRLIARTEMAAVTNGGALAATKLLDANGVGPYFKRWMTAPGAHYPRHEDYEGLDGQTVALDDAFDVGGYALQFPGDPDGPPEEICNCRCTLAFVESQDEPLAGEPEPPPEMPAADEADVPLEPVDGDTAPELADAIAANAVAMEPYITEAIQAATEPLGGHLQGYEYRLKSESSIKRKIETDYGSRLPGVPPAIAASAVKDGLRYTVLYRPGEYVDKMTKTLDALKAGGIEPERVRASWAKGSEYVGTNALMKAPNGYRFELQFHTPQSYNVKEFVNHDEYEVWRKISDKSSPEALALSKKMSAAADDVRRPAGIETWTYSGSVHGDIGVTPFREGVDDPVGFYDSEKFARFEKDARELADYYNVSLDLQERATGVWEGTEEPSVHLSVHDGETGVRAYAAALGRAYRQDGVAIFTPDLGEAVIAQFRRPPSVEGGKFVIADDIGTGKLGGGVPSAEEAQDAITAVLKMPEDVSIESLPDGATETASLGNDGKIGIHEGSDFQIQTSAITHEYGHYVDSRVLGTPGEWFTEMGEADDAELYQLLKNSETMKEVANNEWSLVGEENYMDRNYYLQGREMFARAFEQYVAEKSANPTLLSYVERIRADDQLGFQFWKKDEFAPISAKLDEIFAKNDLLREEPAAALDPDRVYEAMARAELPAGRFLPDGTFEVIGSGPEFVRKLDSLSHDLGVGYDAYLGKFDLLEARSGDYEAAIGDAQGARAVQARQAGRGAAGLPGAPPLGEGARGAQVRSALVEPPGSLVPPPDVSPPTAPPGQTGAITDAMASRLSVDNLWGEHAAIGQAENVARAVLPDLHDDRIVPLLWAKADVGLKKSALRFSDLSGDQQVHTFFSDGHNTVQQVAAEAEARGEHRVVISDHSHAMTSEEIHKQHEMIDALNDDYRKRGVDFKIEKGIEVNILADGSLDVAPEVLADFDVVNAAIHSRVEGEAGQLTLFKEANTERLLRALDNPELDVLVHPHSVAADWDAVATKAAQKGVALEVNGRDLLRNSRQEAAADMIDAAKRHGAKLVIGSDAHSTADLVDVLYAVRFASTHGVTPEDLAPFARVERLDVDPSTSIPGSLDSSTPGAHRLGGGMNEVWKIDTEDGREFIVKPEPDPETLRDMGFDTGEPLRENVPLGKDIERERAAYVVSRLFNEVGGEDYHVNVPTYRIGELSKKTATGEETKKAGIAEFISGEEGRRSWDWHGVVRDDELHSAALYDAIIGNTDRHAGNFIFDDVDENLWLIDHGLAFPVGEGSEWGQNAQLVEAWRRRAAAEGEAEISEEDAAFLRRFARRLPDLFNELRRLLTPDEIDQMAERVDSLLRTRDFGNALVNHTLAPGAGEQEHQPVTPTGQIFPGGVPQAKV